MDSSNSTNIVVDKYIKQEINPMNIDSTQSNCHQKNKKDILVVLIYIYYYEKNELNFKKGISFKEKENYFLIKSSWIKELKKYYDYQKISKILDEFILTQNRCNIPNLDNLQNNNILEKTKLHLNNSNINILNKQPNADLINPEIKLLPIKFKKKFFYYSNGYIINSKILEIIENYMFEGQKINIRPITILNKENNIIISLKLENVFSTFGNLNNELIYIANSCLAYYNLKIFNNEKNHLLNLSFKDYIISRKCQENNLKVQTLIKEVDKKAYKIGLFLKIYKEGNPKINLIIENFKKNQKNLMEENKNLKEKIQKLEASVNDREKEIVELKNEVSRLSNQPDPTTFKVIGGTDEGNNFQKSFLEREYLIKNEELNERMNQILIKEKEIHDKMISLNDRESLLKKESQELINDKNQNQNLKQQNILLKSQNRELEEQLKQKQKQLSQNNDNVNVGRKALLSSSYQPDDIMNYIESKKKESQEKDNVDEGKKILLSSQYHSDEIIDFIYKRKNQKENQLQNLNLDTLSTISLYYLPNGCPLQAYKEPIFIGLDNTGSACYINAVLQCLNQIPSLTNYFLNDFNREVINNHIIKESNNLLQLSPAYLELTKMLWDNNKKESSFSPINFINTVEKMNPLFKKGNKGDYKDFIIFILEQIHKELKKPTNFQKHSVPVNQYDRNISIKNFINDFQKEGSIISDIFFGIIETTNVCLNCKRNCNLYGQNYPICYNYGKFNSLVFPLEEVRNFKNNSWNNQIIQNNNLTLDDCFFYNQKTERFTGENQNYCNICRQLYDCEYTSRIYSSPNVLILILTRRSDNKYNIKLDFGEILDLTQFVQSKDCPRMIYNLKGVITQVEQSFPNYRNEYYIGFFKSPINNKWYSCNDTFINLVQDVQKEIINFGNPVILFYQKFK